MSQDVESLKSFIEKYPDSRHIDEAKILLDDKIYEKMGSNIESLKSFIEKYPDSRHIDEAKARYKKAVDKNISIAGLHMVYVLGGCYQMGDIFGDGGEDDEKPVHEVCIDDFYIGKYEVTQGQWEKIMGYNPSFFDDGDRYPVENVSWNGVQGFIEELNSQSGKNFRLPTEAEWEYAARSGGKRQKYAGGNNVDAVAWYDDNSGDRPHPVGQKEPNDLGIYDMSGNVWEWVSDWYEDDYYAQSPRNNPTGPSSSSYSLRVLRGGDYSIHFEQAEVVRSTSRSAGDPYDKYMFHGFRLALPAK
ncbi:SUMF1/EgtB/PvdO family nonheme iron enzyme [Flexistipes sp.]|uniref:formylglycine-generating enzyme family protein n=1 Tax=Flexistipes sp. TaxID=3088135 RepID=UPI003FA5AA2D